MLNPSRIFFITTKLELYANNAASLVTNLQVRRHTKVDARHYTLQIITEAHPNWPVYADIFEHPPPWLASRRQYGQT